MWPTIMTAVLVAVLVTAEATAADAGKDATKGDSAVTAQSGQDRQLDPNLPGIGDQDQEFAYSAYALLTPLVEMSELGVEKASHPEIVDLSKQMADDYAKLAKDLEQAAQEAGIDATKGEAPHGENRLNRLQVSGDEFDLAYLIEQEGLHDKLIAIYTMAASGEKGGPLAQHAKKGQEVLTRNYDEIAQLRERFAEIRSSQ